MRISALSCHEDEKKNTYYLVDKTIVAKADPADIDTMRM